MPIKKIGIIYIIYIISVKKKIYMTMIRVQSNYQQSWFSFLRLPLLLFLHLPLLKSQSIFYETRKFSTLHRAPLCKRSLCTYLKHVHWGGEIVQWLSALYIVLAQYRKLAQYTQGSWFYLWPWTLCAQTHTKDFILRLKSTEFH